VHFVDAWRGGPRLSEHLPAGGHAKDLLSELGPKLTGWADRNAPIQYPPAIAQWQADAARLNGRLGALTPVGTLRGGECRLRAVESRCIISPDAKHEGRADFDSLNFRPTDAEA